VFAQKDDGRFRARNVAQGFTQIPGKDFQEHHSPVVNDTTVHAILVIKISKKLCSGQFDIVTAFLYGELDEILFMALPEGYLQFLKQKTSEDPGYNIPLGNGVTLNEITDKDYCLS
jgi:Reverse transcriptase (RNA-dependent DNA polymerase)